MSNNILGLLRYDTNSISRSNNKASYSYKRTSRTNSPKKKKYRRRSNIPPSNPNATSNFICSRKSESSARGNTSRTTRVFKPQELKEQRNFVGFEERQYEIVQSAVSPIILEDSEGENVYDEYKGSCWWCTYEWDGKFVGCPYSISKSDNSIKLEGFFCSWNCAQAYGEKNDTGNVSRT